MPLLKVLGGASLTDLAEDAASRLPASTVPMLEGLEASPDLSASSDPHSHSSEGALSSATSDSQHETGDNDSEPDIETEQAMLRQEVMSLAQEHSWRLEQMLSDRTIFNNSIGMFMEGQVDLDRLARSLRSVIRRHEIFRTGFEQHDGEAPQQSVMKRSQNKVKVVSVANRAAAEQAYRQIATTNFDISKGDTLRLAIYNWDGDKHLLIVAYHRLVGDGSTTENLFVEATKSYSGMRSELPSLQFKDFAVQQRQSLANGDFDSDIEYWRSMHAQQADMPILPLMSSLVGDEGAASETLPRAPCSWHQHEAIARLDPMVAFRIKERSRKHKTTPMVFYLTAFHVLLGRLTEAESINIGIADTNRSTIEQVSAMGFFAGLLPLRMQHFNSQKTFGEHLVHSKDLMREALQHAKVPSAVILQRLGFALPTTAAELEQQTHAPLAQAVFDYRQGQAESGQIGQAKMSEVIAIRERTQHDVVLEMSDDPTKDPLITVKLQSSIYDETAPQKFLDEYINVLSMFSMNPALKLAKS